MAGKHAKKKPPKLVVTQQQQQQTRAQPAAAAANKPAKAAKDKQHKQHKHAGKHEKSDDAVLLMRKQLAAVGCKLLEVEADGNCLFRSLGDQLYGDQHQHAAIRKRIVDFIERERDAFEPFMEDDEPFEHYCKRMRDDGTWGGNQELYAAARVYQVDVVLHQESGRLVIECDARRPLRVLHVAFHGSDHYDSVRSVADPRWQTQSAQQQIATESLDDDDDDEQTRCVVQAVATLQLDGASTSNTAAAAAANAAAIDSRTRSKKEQRQLRKAARNSRSAAKSAVRSRTES